MNMKHTTFCQKAGP